MKAFTASQRKKLGWCRCCQMEYPRAFRKTRWAKEKLEKERIQLRKNNEKRRRERFKAKKCAKNLAETRP